MSKTTELKISIITVCKNSSAYIEETIKSVLQQTYQHIQYLIIDGKSTDSTCSIVEKYAEWIDTFISEPDNGMYEAINKGLSLAKGDYILVLNSDDALASNDIIEKAASEMEKSPADYYYGNILHLKSNRIRKVRLFPVNFNMVFYSTHSTFVPHPCLFVSSKLNKGLGGYDEQYQFASDFDYILRAMSAAGIRGKYLNLDITKFRIHDASISASGKITHERHQILKKHGYFNKPLIKRKLLYFSVWVYYKIRNLKFNSNH